eukprot:scaffold191698_cov29-Prasinocladus_malaysianus.AAC.2
MLADANPRAYGGRNDFLPYITLFKLEQCMRASIRSGQSCGNKYNHSKRYEYDLSKMVNAKIIFAS